MVVPMPRGDQLSRQWRLIQLIDRPQGITWRSPSIVQHALPRVRPAAEPSDVAFELALTGRIVVIEHVFRS
jgi:hypothetical protein